MGCIWLDVCWCYVAVWLWWCGIRMQAEALVLQPAYGYHTKVLVFRRVRKVAKNVYYSRHVCLSVCLSARVAACVSRATTWPISLKFDIKGSYDNLWRKIELG